MKQFKYIYLGGIRAGKTTQMDDEKLKARIKEYWQGSNPMGGQLYQGQALGAGNFTQISTKVAISESGPDRTTISQAIDRRIEACEKEAKRLQQRAKELSELRDALNSVRHFPMHMIYDLLS